MPRTFNHTDKDGKPTPYINEGRKGRNLPKADKKMAKRLRIAVRLGMASQEQGLIIRSPRVRRLIERVAR